MGWRRARALVESCGGRRDGWRLELDGAHVGDLIAPLYVEMFWVSYELVPTSTEAEASLRVDDTWERLRYWSRAMKEFAVTNPFPAGGYKAPSQRRLNMRRLHLLPQSRWERALQEVAGHFTKGFELPLDENYIGSLEIRLERMKNAEQRPSALDVDKFAKDIEQRRRESKLYLEGWKTWKSKNAEKS